MRSQVAGTTLNNARRGHYLERQAELTGDVTEGS